MFKGFFEHPLVKIFFTVVFTFAVILFLIFLILFFINRGGDIVETIPDNSIGVITISGIITKSEDVIKDLKKFSKDKHIKAVIIKLNSPGGGVVPSQEIYSEILRIRKKKRVYAYFQSVAASGAYYIASACNKIVSNPGSITGSIGVILEFTNFEKLFDKLGIKAVVVKSGKFKDTGNPFRPVTEEEKALLNSVVLNIYNQFLKAVSINRHIPVEKLKKIADGRVFSGEQALHYKLVDQTGTFEDLVDVIKKECNITGEPKIIYAAKKKNLLNKLIEDSEKAFLKLIETKLYYIKSF